MSGNAFVAEQRSGWLRAKVLAKQMTQWAETTGKHLSFSQASMPSTSRTPDHQAQAAPLSGKPRASCYRHRYPPDQHP